MGVSFDQNNVVDGSFTDATYYVRGGVPISLPAKDAPFEKLDYGMVVFSTSAVNSVGETIQDRWGSVPGALTPVQVAPNQEYLSSLVDRVQNQAGSLAFTAVGYGTGEKFPIPGQETGPADPPARTSTTFADPLYRR